jgi:DNA-binding LacI/PurR family transcriptional regulator
MREAPSCRSIADAMASKAASYIHIAPPEHRDAVMASIAEGFRDACQEHGIPIEAGDIAYYVEVVTAKAAEMRKMRPD